MSVDLEKIIKNHEQRIRVLEVEVAKLGVKIDDLKESINQRFDGIEEKIDTIYDFFNKTAREHKETYVFGTNLNMKWLFMYLGLLITTVSIVVNILLKFLVG